MADRIVVMNQGEIEQIGTPLEIYEKPTTLFVAGFIGYVNLIKGKIKSRQNESLTIATDLGEFINMNEELKGFKVGDEATIVIRPEAVCLEKASPKREDNIYAAQFHNLPLSLLRFHRSRAWQSEYINILYVVDIYLFVYRM